MLIAPGGRHMRLASSPDAVARAQITDDPPENNCRPAVDYLFRSAANALPGRAMAVILTGMGNDGTLGLRLLKRHGCFTIAQDEATSVVFGMPKAAIEAGVVDLVLPLDAIAARILATVKGRGSSNRLDETEFRLWASYVYSITRITLDASKGYLIEPRLAALARESGSQSFKALLDKVTTDGTGALKRKVIGAITTNETSFFRDTSPFEMLRHKILPDLVDARRRNLATAAPSPCASGALRARPGKKSTVRPSYAGKPCQSEQVRCAHSWHGYLGQGHRAGQCGQVHQAGNRSWFPSRQGGGLLSGRWRHFKVRDSIRALATFKTINLLEPLSFPSKFDLIFCRNVAIYFSDADKRRLYDGLSRVLAPDGCLIIGSTESLTGICPRFEPKRHLRSIFYQLGPS